jgi:hypothetical protein
MRGAGERVQESVRPPAITIRQKNAAARMLRRIFNETCARSILCLLEISDDECMMAFLCAPCSVLSGLCGEFLSTFHST